jgi:SAM-dependent MidA family methyltransferase
VNELERQIREEIAARGPMPFARFMELALYDPAHGYYSRARDPFGVAGDYYTSSQLQPVFGRLIAQKIAERHRALGAPADFTVVELGAGRGETAREVRACLPQVRYVEIDRNRGDLPQRFTGVVFSNEFFDALPVRVVRGSRERFVGIEQGKLAWIEGEPSSPLPSGNGLIEINLAALEWLERIARSLERGFVLTIDYGSTAEELAGGRFPEGSLMSYSRHVAHEDVLADPGERDITAHVNFTALAEHGRSIGLRPHPLQTQAQFLLAIGEADEFQTALAAANEQEAQRHRLLLKTLLFGMGETFRVLVQEKL